MQLWRSSMLQIQATTDEIVVLKAAISFSLGYAQLLPPEARKALERFQQRLAESLPASGTNRGQKR